MSAPMPGSPGAPGAPLVSGTGASVPSPLRAFRAEYRVLLRNVATRGRLGAIGTLALLSLLTAVAVATAGPDEPLRAATAYVNANLSTLVPVAVLVFGAGAIGDLLDDGSLVYLWLRPVPAWVHVLAACAATITITIPLVLGPVLLAAALIDPSAAVLTSTALSGLVAVLTYSCLFVMGGIRFRRALPWGLVYILIWEGFIASAGKTATKLAIRSYIRSILSNGTGVSMKLAVFTTGSALAVCLAVCIVSVAYGARRLANTDVP